MRWDLGFRLVALTTMAVLASCSGSDGADGAAGKDGSSCTVKDNGDGTNTVSCTDGTSITLQNGKDGEDGTNGTNGTSCSITDNGDGTRTIHCTDGTTGTIGDGEDGTSCTVADNGNGTKTISCTDGTSVTVTDGSNGKDGAGCTVASNGDGSHTIRCDDGSTVTVVDGNDGGNVEIENFHGIEHLLRSGEFETDGKFFATATIDGATADPAGVVTVNFTVKDAAGEPVTALQGFGANIAKLVPPAPGEKSTVWVPYLRSKQTVSGSATGNWPNPDGTFAWQGARETNGTLTSNGDGTYVYTFKANLSAISYDGVPVTYERDRLHRVSIMLGGHAGPTDDAVFDFVPDGSTNTDSRDIVRTAACLNCHGKENFHGHGGDRLTVENCVTCHTAGMVDPQGGESLDMKVMIHKIHAGKDLASIPGDDGIVFDDPATPADETEDNGVYAIWGYRNSMHTWWKAGFPAEVDNCTKCHEGEAAQVDSWKTNPSREACGSCHDTVDWATGTHHGGGKQENDLACTVCHQAEGEGGFAESVTEAHDGPGKDARATPEYEVALSVSTPANGKYFTAGETPVVTIVLSQDGTPIDHNTVIEDGDGVEGCRPEGCPPGDGKFASAGLFVHGPRAFRRPVLTTSARAAVLSSGTGPFDLGAAGASLALKVDQGTNVVQYNGGGGDVVRSGTITVPVTAASFATLAAATTGEIVAWLNGNAAFRARAIAYDQTGRVGIRSRALGKLPAVQLQASAVATSVFGGDLTLHLMSGGYTVSNNVAQRTNPANNDPKAVRTTGSITYTLDPVDDLAPGTYVASVEMGDRGRKNESDYRTPSVGTVAFQVKQEAEMPPIAANCDSCHQNADGRGLIVDPARHNKILGNGATDQCGACHDYANNGTAGFAWTGAKPISKRVHAIHNGANLMTPLATVDYSNGDPVKGRNWDITFPDDVRNCQACHPDGETSGTWATNPSRLACNGCHDADAAEAHMRAMTWDPTPADIWSGDEEEACAACHVAATH